MVGTSIGSAPCAVAARPSRRPGPWSAAPAQPAGQRPDLPPVQLGPLCTVSPIVTTTGDGAAPPAPTTTTNRSARPAWTPPSAARRWCPRTVTTHWVVSASPYSISVRAASATCDEVACKINGSGRGGQRSPRSRRRARRQRCAMSPAATRRRSAPRSRRPGRAPPRSAGGCGDGVYFGDHRVHRQRVTGDQATTSSPYGPRRPASWPRRRDRPAPGGCRVRPTPPRRAVRRCRAPRRAPPSDWPLGSAGAGPDTGGKSLPISASTGSGTSGSMNTRGAFASTVAARVVSRAGSPGPEPTNMMRPGLGLRPRVVICVSPTQLPRAGGLTAQPT